MKKIKENKGITLIALIITIIVLLILAVVAISAVQGDGIIAHAKNARDDYKDVQDTENTLLGNYMVQLNNANKGDTNEENTNKENNNKNYITKYEKEKSYASTQLSENPDITQIKNEEEKNDEFWDEYVHLYFESDEYISIKLALYEQTDIGDCTTIRLEIENDEIIEELCYIPENHTYAAKRDDDENEKIELDNGWYKVEAEENKLESYTSYTYTKLNAMPEFTNLELIDSTSGNEELSDDEMLEMAKILYKNVFEIK